MGSLWPRPHTLTTWSYSGQGQMVSTPFTPQHQLRRASVLFGWLVLFFETGTICVALGCPGTHSIGQAIEFCLPNDGIKGLSHCAPLGFACSFPSGHQTSAYNSVEKLTVIWCVVWLYVCVCECVYTVCMSVCVHVCVCVYMCLCVQVCECRPMQSHFADGKSEVLVWEQIVQPKRKTA